MTLETGFGILLAAAALLLLGRDLRRTWHDAWRRPVTLLVAALIALLLVGTLAGRAHPNPWWLALPAAVLVWEVTRGWRHTPRCHLWEGGIAAFSASLVLALLALTVSGGRWMTTLLAVAAAAAALGIGLLWISRRREPRPWRADDPLHYERRRSARR